MSEFGGLLQGGAEARNTARFAPGAMTLHNSMTAHGPDPAVLERASTVELGPRRLEGLAVLFETRLPFRPTRHALETPALQRDYDRNWDALPKRFRGAEPAA